MGMTETLTLPNGVAIPKLGLGTWMIENAEAAAAVQAALELGYRHIDTAQAYANEAGVGKGVRDSGIARDEVFVTTKLAAEIKSYPDAVKAIDGSLQTLGLDYIDLMIIHSPKPWAAFHEADPYSEGNLAAWRALEEAYEAGKLRAIGVSNFQQADLDNLLQNAKIKPMINQILAHISNTPFDLISYIQGHDMLAEAYSPIGHGQILSHPDLQAMAETYGVGVAQLSIRYVLQLGMIALPKTANPDHMRRNAQLDFTITPEDMAVLKAFETIRDYGEAGVFPVYGGRL
ncbi:MULTISPECIES: aldo/keto reductase [Thioclava]|uniref:Aldo/keto reductase n=1 Tax=Thioclava litoralis TaxID=3076557 RepID=A0ABZ1E5V2_9RHOB|nr:aldo/keto reductase [Thioclava sp. FTW29]